MARKNILTRLRIKKAQALAQNGQLPEARKLLEDICRSDRLDAEAWFMLGNVCKQSGDSDAAALSAFQEAVRLGPESAQAHAALGDTLLHADRLEEAVVSLRKVTRLEPSNAEAHARLGRALHSLDHLEEAKASYRRALQLQPHWAAMHTGLGGVLCAQGRIDEAIASHQRAVELVPHDVWTHSNLLLAMQYLPKVQPAIMLAAHRRWAALHDKGPATSEWRNARDPERPLRVGYISADFRAHSTSFFFEPLLAHHDGKLFESFCYAAVMHPDDVTAHLQGLADHWKSIIGLTGTQVANMIRADGIDILVDLAGHTGNNALKVFTYKPAPVQVTWLGYPDTTGLSTIDYRLTDAFCDPPGNEAFHIESLLRLPGCFLCYQPLAGAPDVAPLPALEKGYVTFGSFNHLPKMNVHVIALWVELLAAVPQSRLLIKNKSLTDTATVERYYGLFAARGIGRDRVELTGFTATQAAHLDVYRRIDIALDTFPYNGTTTTCEALWMGVPVVTLAGVRHSGRVGVSLLNAVGLQDWIAGTPEDYIAIATRMAEDIPHLAKLRAGLRQQMAVSLLCYGKGFAAKVETVYREIWRRYCAGHPILMHNIRGIPEGSGASRRQDE
ncbi:MAG: tetratricopeptide repeat protein [Gammaproteobacteria bacterium]|nr:tetratricopeptide repeat protein [Gammaproteobacteria bacterium]